MEILKISGLTKTYRGCAAPAIRGIEFSMESGEMVGIIGSSGAGKSTLMRCVNRLVEPDGGRVLIEGREITGAKTGAVRELRRRVGMVFQHHNLVVRLTVLQNVMHGRLGYMSTAAGALGRYSEDDKLRAVELLEKTGLGEFLYHRAGDLSGGQMQRVGIVRAIMQQPSLLLCDEPIASLDPASAQVVMELIRDICKERGIACLVNLHQVDAALKFAERIVGMKDGEIIYDGPAAMLSGEMIERIYGKPLDQLMIGGGAVVA
ncbi:MAG: phosphonate ABC transporter ATP-binding protein [Oscillospiraceae bacterium]|jgi:phosphonate transport system ATP-binding protein|nr:phosphonate ABC transporter ATP-binding protein [Oscillospiraceae bacterium]